MSRRAKSRPDRKKAYVVRDGTFEPETAILNERLAIQGNELKYMRSLQRGETEGFVGSHQMRTELRRLRTLGLMRNVGVAKIDDLKDNNKFDLARFVELTERGKHYMERVSDVQGA